MFDEHNMYLKSCNYCIAFVGSQYIEYLKSCCKSYCNLLSAHISSYQSFLNILSEFPMYFWTPIDLTRMLLTYFIFRALKIWNDPGTSWMGFSQPFVKFRYKKDIFILSALSDTQTNTSSLIEIVNSLEIVNSRYQEQFSNVLFLPSSQEANELVLLLPCHTPGTLD